MLLSSVCFATLSLANRHFFQTLLLHLRVKSAINDYAKNYFISQPTWLRLISFNTISKSKIKDEIRTSRFKVNSKIGSWKVFDKNDNEMVFGDSMGFMDYRFSMRLFKNNTDDIEVSTVVTYKSSMGKYYFSMVKLMHKKFVIRSLKNSIFA